MGFKLGLSPKRKHRLRVSENKELRKIFGPKSEKVSQEDEDSYIMKSFILSGFTEYF
jgi:hypothetical protein